LRTRFTGKGAHSEDDETNVLSSREEQILGLAASGLSDQEVGQELGISVRTLQTYWKRIRAKLGESGRSELVAEHIRSQSAKLKEGSPLGGSDSEAVSVYLAAELRRSQAAEQKAARALQVLRVFFRESNRAATEQELLQVACEVLVESGGYLMAWFGVPGHDDEKPVTPVARYPASEYLDKIRVSWGDNEFGHGPAGRALRLGEMEVRQDFLVNPAMQPWIAAAQEYGFQSILALPIRLGEDVVMVLTVYAAEPDAFDTQERELLKEFGAAFESRLNTIRESPLSEARLRAMIGEAPFAIRVSRDDMTTYVNQAFVDMFELSSAESILGHHVGEIWTPETREELIGKVARRPDGIPAKSFEGVALLPTGRRMHIHVDVKILDLAEGRTAVAYLSEVKPPEFSKRMIASANS